MNLPPIPKNRPKVKEISFQKWKELYQDELDQIYNQVKQYLLSNELDKIMDLRDSQQEFEYFLYLNSSKVNFT